MVSESPRAWSYLGRHLMKECEVVSTPTRRWSRFSERVGLGRGRGQGEGGTSCGGHCQNLCPTLGLEAWHGSAPLTTCKIAGGVWSSSIEESAAFPGEDDPNSCYSSCVKQRLLFWRCCLYGRPGLGCPSVLWAVLGMKSSDMSNILSNTLLFFQNCFFSKGNGSFLGLTSK